MKLVNARYGIEIVMSENSFDELAIENSEAMEEIVYELLQQSGGEDGAFVLSESSILKFGKFADIIVNPFALDFNNRKIQNALYSSMESIASDMVEEKNSINEAIVLTLDKISSVEAYSGIEYNLDLQWKELFKFYNVHISEEYGSLKEKLTEYIKIMANLCHLKMLCFVGLRSFLSDEELLEMIKIAQYSKIQILLIEPFERKRLECENLYIIDKDLCLIEKKMS